MAPLGGDSRKLMPGFLWTLPLEPFIFAGLAVINHGHEHGNRLSSESSRQIARVEEGLGTPPHGECD